MKKISLNTKKKLIILTSILLIIGFLLTSLASYYVSKATIRNSIIDNELPITSDNIYSEIQKDIVRPILISSLMARDTFLRDWVISGEKNVNELIKYLNEIKSQYNTITSFFVSDRTKIYYYSGGVLKKIKENEWRDKWYFRVRSMKEPYEINVDIDMANKDTLTIFINYKVFDYKNNYIGAAGVGLSVEAVGKLIIDYQKKYKRNIYFVDNEFKISLSGSSDYKIGSDIKTFEGIKNIINKITKEENGSYQYKYKRKNILLNVRYINELKWYLFVEKNEDEAISNIRYALLLNIVICILISIIILFATSFTINRFQSRLENMATIDSLTGLGNRLAYDILMKQAINDVKRNNEMLSCILLDVDNFKNINDIFGHKSGDQALISLSKIIQMEFREADIICRWGGEEFLIVLKKCSLENAFDKAEDLRKILENQYFLINDKEISLTLSIGVGQYKTNETEENFIKRIDKVLYQAKEKGKNKVYKAE